MLSQAQQHGPHSMQRYVVYKRVSTEDQGKSGLGLDAQQRDISLFLERFSEEPWEVLGEFTEVQSGKDDSRPELAKALALVRKHKGSELLVAKLDRLSRDVAFIATTIKDKSLKLRVAQMPHADKFQLHLYAALAEQEREFISQRTRAALRAAKDRGVKLGGLRDTTGARNAARASQARQEAGKVYGTVKALQDSGMSLRAIAERLNALGLTTTRGAAWGASQVQRVLRRAGEGNS